MSSVRKKMSSESGMRIKKDMKRRKRNAIIVSAKKAQPLQQKLCSTNTTKKTVVVLRLFVVSMVGAKVDKTTDRGVVNMPIEGDIEKFSGYSMLLPHGRKARSEVLSTSIPARYSRAL
jgi:hypothetical protein